MTKLIEFTTSRTQAARQASQTEASQTEARVNSTLAAVSKAVKYLTPQVIKGTRYIAAFDVPLIEQVRQRMIADWRRGISITYLAKDYGLSTRQAEAIVWSAQRFAAPPPSAAYPESPRRGLRLVSRAA